MEKIDNSKVIYSFKPNMDFIKKVRIGETFSVQTNDCFLGQIKTESQKYKEIDKSKINPATGPIYIEGAEEGDLLKIKILNIKLGQKGISLLIPGEGVLGDSVKKPVTRIMPVKNGNVEFKDLLIPIRPMIGVIGVAPAKKDGEWSTALPWKHGGNMDTIDISEGATLYLPVRQKGALLALGDCHAIMGDGEVSVTGCEIDAEIDLNVDVIKKKTTIWPLLETSDATLVIASGNTLEEAVKNATNQIVSNLQNALDLSWEDAYILTGVVVDFKISQVVNEKKTVRGRILKSIIKTETLINSL